MRIRSKKFLQRRSHRRPRGFPGPGCFVHRSSVVQGSSWTVVGTPRALTRCCWACVVWTAFSIGTFLATCERFGPVATVMVQSREPVPPVLPHCNNRGTRLVPPGCRRRVGLVDPSTSVDRLGLASKPCFKKSHQICVSFSTAFLRPTLFETHDLVVRMSCWHIVNGKTLLSARQDKIFRCGTVRLARQSCVQTVINGISILAHQIRHS